VVLLAFIACGFDLQAQIKADFSADTLSFCPPYSVVFKDLTTGGGAITSRRWEFGQGGTSNSNNASPSASYTNSGTYNVKLVVSDGINKDSITKTAYIKAFTLPKVGFTTTQPPNGCAPLSLNFVDTTKLGSAPLKSYSWNFGDGYRSTTKNPAHTYHYDGNYTVVLSVVDTNGCSASFKNTSFVKVIKGPLANFSVSPFASSCNPPHKVNFINQSSGTGTLSYFWKFGNLDSSVLKSPSYTFGVGAYDITLIVKNSTGCADTIKRSHFITVGAPKADFDVIDTVCLSDTNKVFFKDRSVGANTFLWSFGDGIKSSKRNPSHNYKKTGTYSVQLIIGLATPCSDTITKTIEVIQPIVSFTTDIDYWCDNKKVEYTPSGTYANEAKTLIWDYWKWPDYKINRAKPKTFGPNSILKKRKGKHIDTLTVFYPKWGSCSSKVILQKFEIWRPDGHPLIDPYTGCAPLTVQLKDRMLPHDSVTVGTWLFDGKNPRVTRSTSQTYTVPGNYSVSYTFKHKRLGCVYKYGPYIIEVGKKQKADFKVEPLRACVNDTVKFINTSTDTNKIKKYSWNLHWANRIPFTHNKNEMKQYQDTGYKSIMLIVDNGGCPDTLIRDSAVFIMGPIGDFAQNLDCDKRYDREFIHLNWFDVQRFKYDFGDTLGYDSLNRTANYIYNRRGDFKVKLTLYNDTNGCKLEIEKMVWVRDLKFVSSINKHVGCYPTFFSFKVDKSQDLARVLVHSYGNISTGSPTTTFSIKSKKKGFDRPMLVGSDDNGCTDTAYYWVKTYLPTANFTVSQDSGCAPFLVTVKDSSVTDTTFSSLKWAVAENQSDTQKTSNFTFRTAGKKFIQLTVRDTLGCVNAKTKWVYSLQPHPAIAADTQVCTGIEVQFFNKGGQPNETHAWSFGDTLTGTGKSPKIKYTRPGRKSIRLTSTDNFGCDSTLNKNLWIEVQKAVLPTVVSEPEDTTCYPADIDFTIKNPDSTVRFYFWRFDTADAFVRLSGPNAFYNYNKPGVFGVDIGVETTFGCRDTFRVDSVLRVGGPYARFDMKDTFCFQEESEFNLKEVSGVYEFRMDFGDGNLDTFPQNTDTIRHFYLNGGFYPVSLIFTDSLGSCVKSIRDSVFIQEIQAKINIRDTSGCSVFKLNVKADTANVNKYQWSINGDTLSSNQVFSQDFSEPGERRLILKPINTNTGCYNLDSVRFTVFPLPSLSKSGDGLYCYDDSILVVVSGAKDYLWTPSDFLSSSSSDSVKLKPENDIIYSVEGTNEFGCKSLIDLKFNVVKPPYLKSFKDTTLYVGQVINLDQGIEGEWIYKWTPAFFLSCSDCPNPELKANRDITYNLNISDKYGCFSIDTSFSVFAKDEYKLFIPNAFTPNSDGLNDLFDFYAEGFKKMEYFRIYTRWGEEVYEFTSMEDGWDGLYNGEFWPTNVSLVYKGRFIRFNKEAVDVVGSVTIVR